MPIEEIEDISQDDFDNLVSIEKKHRELINSIRELMVALKPIDNTNKISELVKSNKVVVDFFLNKLKEISEIKIPQVNNEELIQALTEIQQLLSEKKAWEFKVERNFNDRITGVTAIQINSKAQSIN